MSEIRFALPVALLLLIPPLFLWVQRFRLRNELSFGTMGFSDTRLLRNIPSTWRLRLRSIPLLLDSCGYILIVVALARPQAGIEAFSIAGSGIDLVIALDISDSMGQADMNSTTRLDSARQVTSNYVRERTSDRIGLVTFAEDAYLLAPPTLDHNLLQKLLNSVTYATTLQVGNRSAIGSGLIAASRLLLNSTAPSRAVLLITDGANNAGILDPITAAEAIAALGLRVYTIGMGAESATSDLDFATLDKVATITGGRYFRAVSPEDLTRIYKTIQSLETSDSTRQLSLDWQDQALTVIVVALSMLCLSRLLQRTVFQTIP